MGFFLSPMDVIVGGRKRACLCTGMKEVRMLQPVRMTEGEIQLRRTCTTILNQGSAEEKREEIRQYFHKTY